MSIAFSAERLAASLAALDRVSGLCVAFSGGRDSTVLLHALALCRQRLSVPVRAVHVDHGLHAESPDWSRHCAEVCANLGIPLRCLSTDAGPAVGVSPEAAARDARYAAIAAVIQPREALLTAHHRDDQAETLLLQLLRGAGPRGLAAMPERVAFAGGSLVRPLLAFSRDQLARWAADQGLGWIEDPSNAEPVPDRNFLRHRVLPLLRQRWPAADLTLARAAAHQGDALQLLGELGRRDLARVEGGGSIDLAAMSALPIARRRNLLRSWLQREGLRAPPSAVLERVFTELVPAAGDRCPSVVWSDGELRRYRGRLYLLRGGQEPAAASPQGWDLGLPLAFAGQRLSAQRVIGQGLRETLCREGVTVSLRRGGERCRPLGDAHHRRLKALLREAGIPPWRRKSLPLVSVGDRLVQVVGLCIDHDSAAGAGEPGVLIRCSDAASDDACPAPADA